ncbi:glycosyltransferase, partial [bacterium]|nr:glycosyltransferase [bacterium]
MSLKPLLSILIPTHNREDLLKETLESVFKQKSGLDRIEVIISDDASKDGTQLYLQNLLKNHKKFPLSVFHHEKNLGGPQNWKFLLSKAQGEFVYLLSDDDTIKPTFLEKYFDCIKNHPQVDLIYSGIEYCDDHMQALSQSRISSVPGLVSGKERLKNQLIANHMVMSSIYRREKFLQVGGWQEKYQTCLDGAAFAHMCTVSEWTYFIEEALFSFRLGNQTWSSFKVEKQKKQYQSFRLLIDDIFNWAQKDNSNDLNFYKKCYSA